MDFILKAIKATEDNNVINCSFKKMVFIFFFRELNLEQWFSNFLMQQNHIEGFKTWIAGPILVSDWIGLGWETSFQGPPEVMVKTTAVTVTNDFHSAKSNS